MKQSLLIRSLAVAICLTWHIELLQADPARFWISPSPTDPFWSDPSGSDILHVDLLADVNQPASKQKLYIWAQPAREGSTFRQLQSFSLDIVSTAPFIDFLDEGEFGAIVDNPGLPGEERFAFVRDSTLMDPDNSDLEFVTVPPESIHTNNLDAIVGLQGLNLATPEPTAGIGPSCMGVEQGCVITEQGPVWRIGSFGLQSMDMPGVADIELRIGAVGMNHLSADGTLNEPTALTQVIFSATESGPVYTAGGQSGNRQEKLNEDNPEVRVIISEQLVGDYTSDGEVDGEDFLLWQTKLGDSSLPNRSTSVNGIVTHADLHIWEVNYGESIPGASASQVVPEPHSLFLAGSALILGLFCRGISIRNGFGKQMRKSTLKATALCLSMFIAASQQALGVIDVDPGNQGANNVWTFPSGNPTLFTDPPTAHVTLTSPFAVGHNFNSRGTVLVNGGSSITSNTSGNAHTLGTGIVIANVDPLAPTVGSTGILTVHGTNSTVTSNSNLTVGVRGSGTLNIWDGAAVNSNVTWLGYYSGTTGAATIWGSNARWEPKELSVGFNGIGTIDIAGGGRLGYSSHVGGSTSYIGFAGTSNGTVTVGNNSTFYGGELFRVGQAGTGTLTITGGGDVVHNFNPGANGNLPENGLVLGNNANSSGTVNVIGSGSTLTSNKNFSVGRHGSGTLNVQSSGYVESNLSWIGYESSSTGTATVTGSGSVWLPYELAVGVGGTGTLNVTGGGRVGYTSHVGGSTTYLGFGSTGMAEVKGTNSVLYGGETFVVGQAGNGTLEVLEGGTVVHNFNPHPSFNPYTPGTGMVIGHDGNASGTVTVNGSNSSLTSNKNLTVGEFGSGTLNVENGGYVQSNVSWLGYETNSSGTATVTGGGSRWETDELAVGVGGTGTLNVTSGGRVGYDSHLGGSSTYIGFGGTGTAGVSGSNSVLYGGETFVVGQGATGTLNITGGGSVIHKFNPNADAYTPGTGLVIGHNAGASGTVTVGGTNSLLSSEKNLTVGEFGTATLDVQAGGRVTSNVSWLGYHSDSNGTAKVRGSAARWEPKELAVGVQGTGTIDVSNSGRLGYTSHVGGSTTYIGFDAGSTGTVDVDGNGTIFYGSETFAVGHVGNGTLNIENGGSVVHNFNPTADEFEFGSGLVIGDNYGSTGTVNVSGLNSTLTANKNLAVGGRTIGTLTIENQGTVTSNVSWLGYETGSDGIALVTGNGSHWDAKQLTIGQRGTGTLNIENNAQVGHSSFASDRHTFLAFDPDSSGDVTVDGSGSTLYGGTLFRIGQNGSGTLNITDGGTVVHNFNPGGNELLSQTGVVLGNSIGSTGTVNVTGANSSLAANKNLTLGRFGSGTLNVASGGTVNSNISWLGFQPGSSGTATVEDAGSQWNATELYVGGNSSSSGGTGTLTVRDNGVVNVTNGLTIWPDGRLKGNGEVIGNISNAGRVAPGNSPGILTVDGDFTQTSSGILEIEIEGTGTPGIDYDQLQVTGTVALGGTIEVVPFGGYTPTLGDSITAVTAGMINTSITPRISAPGLDEFNSNTPGPELAIRVSATPSSPATPTDIEIEYVQKAEIELIDGNSTTNWFLGSGWDTGVAPTSSDETLVTGSFFDPQRVEIDGLANVHALRVTDLDGGVTIDIGDSGTLNATAGNIVIESGGAIELDDQGLLSLTPTKSVLVTDSGMLSGAGKVEGSVSVGTAAGIGEAMLSPGTIAATVGTFEIEGAYTQGSTGVFSVDITDALNDRLEVGESATLDGKLQLDLTNLGSVDAGDIHTLLTADSGSGQFEEIQIIDPNGVADDLYFSPFYGSPPVVGGIAAVAEDWLSGGTWLKRGDATGDGAVNEKDAQVFAAVLTGIDLPGFLFDDGSTAALNFLSAFDFSSEGAVDGVKIIDLDDVAGFVQALANSQAVSTVEAYSQFELAYEAALTSRVPEPSTISMIAIIFTSGILRRTRG